MDSMRVRAVFPGGHLAGELRGRSDVVVSFTPGSYARFDEREIERQLASVAKLLWTARMKEYYRAVSESVGQEVTQEPPAVGRQDQEYYAARDDLVAEGWSTDGRVRIVTQGMLRWSVTVADGTLRTLTEQEFADRVGEAAARLIADQMAKIRVLKDRCYGRELHRYVVEALVVDR
ncbi:hypothetical protein ACFOX0_16890 [Micromonospora zhanjiangensis]|uniref:YbaB/EbfC DNA-binding family protein n=2 Tax=Micromonospora zhanjiangensis TaxID=1522057 RepID=A0ABV8KNE2_9ACTN